MARLMARQGAVACPHRGHAPEGTPLGRGLDSNAAFGARGFSCLSPDVYSPAEREGGEEESEPRASGRGEERRRRGVERGSVEGGGRGGGGEGWVGESCRWQQMQCGGKVGCGEVDAHILPGQRMDTARGEMELQERKCRHAQCESGAWYCWHEGEGAGQREERRMDATRCEQPMAC